MAVRVDNTKLMEVMELISQQGFSGMAEAMQIILNEAMVIERARYLQAQPYERNPLRQDYANGFKAKQLKTQLGELSLNVPQVRESGFYPSFLEKGIRSESLFRNHIFYTYHAIFKILDGFRLRLYTSSCLECCNQ